MKIYELKGYSSNSDHDAPIVLGSFSSPEKAEEAKKKLIKRNSNVDKHYKQYENIAEDVSIISTEYTAKNPRPTLAKNEVKARSASELIAYLNVQIAKGNIEQAEATRAEIHEINEENRQIKLINKKLLSEYIIAMNKYDNVKNDFIKLRIGEEAFNLYSNYHSGNHSTYEGFEINEVELDVLRV